MFKRIIFASIFLLLTAALGAEVIFSAPDGGPEITFLDVGQGDAILIETANGRNILIDGGPDKKVIKELSQNLDFGDRTLDLVVLTHPHSDHLTGLNSVLERFEVGRILVPPVEPESPAYKYFLKRSDKLNIPTLEVTAPFQAELAPDCDLDLIYPFEDSEWDNLNNASLVSRLDCSGLSFLFTGDIEKEVEKEILDRNPDLDSDVLKVAHHGSADSGSKEFLRAVSPDLAVIPVGEDNRPGHPDLRTIKKLQRTGALILRTDENGAVKVEKGEEKWRIVPEK